MTRRRLLCCKDAKTMYRRPVDAHPFFAGMDVKIRRAEAHDVPRMLELVRELALFERAPEEVTVNRGAHA
jgi:hypothetical protein